MAEPQKVTVIGVGLIGGSISLAVKSRWPQVTVTGFDIDSDVQSEALSQGVIDEIASDIESSCAGADFVFIATPVLIVPRVIEAIASVVGEETIVTDVGSTKTAIVEIAEKALPPTTNFIGGHPLAGSEQAGLQAATPELLKDSVYVLTPTKRTSPDAFQKLHQLLTNLGAKVIALSPNKHDEIVAGVSHLPHLTATALVNVVAAVEEEGENRLLFAAGGFRDLTRIASGNPELWADICLDNKEAIAVSIDKLTTGLNNIRQVITVGDRDRLLKILATAKDRRASMSSAAATTVIREFNISVSDKPGIISQITLTFGQLGINIEDIQIVHLGGDSGVVRLLVNDSPRIHKALSELKNLGHKITESRESSGSKE